MHSVTAKDLKQGQISLLPQDPNAGSITLNPAQTSPTYNSDFTGNLAGKYNAVMGPNSPGVDAIVGKIAQGQKSQIDQELAIESDNQSSALRGGIIRQMAASRGAGNLGSPDDAHIVDSLSNDELHSADKDTILAKRYADSFVNTAATTPGSNLATPQPGAPDDTGKLDDVDRTSFAAQKSMIAQNAHEVLAKKYDDSGFMNKANYWIGHMLVPGFSWAMNKMTRVAGAPEGGGTGSDIAEQIGYLYSLPPSEMQKQLQKKLDDLWDHDPGSAVDFAQAMTSFSKTDQAWGNIGDAIDVAAGAGAALRAGDAVAGAARAARGAGETIDFTKGAGKKFADAKNAQEAQTVDGSFTKAPEGVTGPGRPNTPAAQPQSALPAPNAGPPAPPTQRALPSPGAPTEAPVAPEGSVIPMGRDAPAINLPDQTGTIYGKDGRLVQGPPERHGPPEIQGPTKGLYAGAQAGRAAQAARAGRLYDQTFQPPSAGQLGSSPSSEDLLSGAKRGQVAESAGISVPPGPQMTGQAFPPSTGELQGASQFTPDALAASLYKGKGGLPVPYEPHSFDLIPTGEGLPKRANGGAQSLGEMQSSRIASVIQNDPKDLPRIVGQLGLHNMAAKLQLMEDVAKGDPTGLLTLQPQDIDSRLPSAFSVERAFQQNVDRSATARNAATDAINRGKESPVIANSIRIDRLSQEQLPIAAAQQIDDIKRMYPSLTKKIYDTDITPAEFDPYSNLNVAHVRFGPGAGETFGTVAEAKAFGHRFIEPMTGSWEIHPEGIGGYTVQVNQHIAETGDFRNLAISDTSKTPGGVVNNIPGMRYLRSADYLVSNEAVKARGRVVHSTEFMRAQLSQASKPIRALSKEEFKDFEALLVHSDVNRNWLQTEGGIRTTATQVTGHAPSPKVVAAYKAYTNLYDVDFTVRNGSLRSQLGAKGGQQITIQSLQDKGAGDWQMGKYQFTGKVVDDIPWSKAREANGHFAIQTYAESGVPDKTIWSQTAIMNDKVRARLTRMQAEGYQVVLEPQKATYHLVKTFQRDVLPDQQVNYNAGGHHVQRYPYFGKQAKVTNDLDGKVHRYTGDTALFNAPTHAAATEIAKAFEDGRQMILRGDLGALTHFQTKLGGVTTMGEFMGKIADGTISLHTPIVATRSGQRTVSVSNWANKLEGFIDVPGSPHNFTRDVTAPFVGEQSELPLDVFNSENGTIFELPTDGLLKPYQAFQVGLNQLTDLVHANDLRIKLSQDFSQEFGHLFEDGQGAVMSNPIRYMMLASKGEGFAPHINSVEASAARRVAVATNQLVQFHSAEEAEAIAWKSAVADAAYNKLGDKGRDLFNQKIAPMIENGDGYLRAVAFHSTMGLFNPKQFFIQAQEVVKAISVSPQHALPSAYSLIPMRWAAFRIDQIDHIARKFGWAIQGMSPENWRGMVTNFVQSGFGQVSHDMAYLDHSPVPVIPGMSGAAKLQSAAQSVLHAGTMPFSEGELAARMLAFQTAWRERMQFLGHGALDRYDTNWVLQRAKDLTTNMGRDSMAGIQKGKIGAIMTQWMPYNARVFEQMWDGGLFGNGTKFNRAEKVKIAIGMMAVSGVYGVGAAATLAPAKKIISDWFSANPSAKPADGGATNAILNGMLPWLFHAMVGEKYDFSSYGPSGMDTLYELWNGDKSWGQLLAGASGQKMGQIIMSSFGAAGQLIKDTHDMFEGTGTIQVTTDDLLQPLRQIALADSLARVWEVMNTQKWLSKNGQLIASDATVSEALNNALLGITPERIQEAYRTQGASKDFEDFVNSKKAEMRTGGQRYADYLNDGNEAAALQIATRTVGVCATSGLNAMECQSAFVQGMGSSPLTERAIETWNKLQLQHGNIQNIKGN